MAFGALWSYVPGACYYVMQKSMGRKVTSGLAVPFSVFHAVFSNMDVVAVAVRTWGIRVRSLSLWELLAHLFASPVLSEDESTGSSRVLPRLSDSSFLLLASPQPSLIS